MWPEVVELAVNCVCTAEICDLVSFQWINSRTAVLLDSVEKLHVIDRQTQEELETVEISEVQLVYNSSHFKSLATGGNVSEALVGTNDLLVVANCFRSALSGSLELQNKTSLNHLRNHT